MPINSIKVRRGTSQRDSESSSNRGTPTKQKSGSNKSSPTNKINSNPNSARRHSKSVRESCVELKMKKTFFVLHGINNNDLDYRQALLTTISLFMCPLIFLFITYAVPQFSPYDEEDIRNRYFWNMTWVIFMYSFTIISNIAEFAGHLIYYPYGHKMEWSERIIVLICGVVGGMVPYYVGYAIFKNTPPLAYFWVQNGVISFMCIAFAFCFYKNHWGQYSVENKKTALKSAVIFLTIFMMCGFSSMVYYVLLVIYRYVEEGYFEFDHNGEVSGVSNKATLPLMGLSLTFAVWKELFYYALTVLYQQVDANMISIGQVWTLFSHSFYLSILLGGEFTKITTLLTLVAADLGTALFSAHQVYYLQKATFSPEKKDDDVFDPNENNTTEVEEKKTEKRKSRTSVLDTLGLTGNSAPRLSIKEIDDAATKFLDEKSPITEYATYIIVAELVEVIVPCIYLIFILFSYNLPMGRLFLGVGSNKFGFTSIRHLGPVVSNLMNFIIAELLTCLFIVFICWKAFKIHLMNIWVHVCNIYGITVVMQSTTVLNVIVPVLFLPFAMDPYLKFDYLQ